MLVVCKTQLVGCLFFALLLSGCNDDADYSSATNTDQTVVLTDIALLGKQIFFDKTLSASGLQSCASCHVASRAHASDDNLAVPLGGPMLTTQGFRNAPSLNYLQYTPAFHFDNEGTPTGGFNRDGRAISFATQAKTPLLAAHEMANGTAKQFADKLAGASYVGEFMRIFGDYIFENPNDVLHRATMAIEQYEQQDASFHPFDSKFDFFLTGRAQLTKQELHGLALFNNPTKGNCASCHSSTRTVTNLPPLFTDFTYDNLGVPRNMKINANVEPAYYDLGLCGPDRTDLAKRQDLCGAFKVPTLRNVALTAPYFHNGIFNTLKEVVSFYARRDTNPEQWYPINHNGVEQFNDLPAAYHRNVNTTEVPYNRHLGDQPALNDDEIDAIVTFLNTLTDGYTPTK